MKDKRYEKRIELKKTDVLVLMLLDKFVSLDLETLHKLLSSIYSRNSLRLRIDKLFKYGYIDKFQFDVKKPVIYFLTQKGCNLVNESWHQIEYTRKPASFNPHQVEHQNIVGKIANELLIRNKTIDFKNLKSDRDLKLEKYLEIKSRTFNQKMFMREWGKVRRGNAFPDLLVNKFAFEIELHYKGKQRTLEKIRRLANKNYVTFWVISKKHKVLRELIEQNTRKDKQGNLNNYIVYLDEIDTFDFNLEHYNYIAPEQISLL